MVKCYKCFNIIIDYNVLIGKNGNVIIVMDFLIFVFRIACIWVNNFLDNIAYPFTVVMEIY